MALCRVFQNFDGSLRILHAKNLDEEMKKVESLQGLPFLDIDTSLLPQDETKRYAWRIRGRGVSVDDTIPEPLTTKKILISELNQSTTIADIKAVIAKMLDD